MGAPIKWSHRLNGQDTTLSMLRYGFDSRWLYQNTVESAVILHRRGVNGSIRDSKSPGQGSNPCVDANYMLTVVQSVEHWIVIP